MGKKSHTQAHALKSHLKQRNVHNANIKTLRSYSTFSAHIQLYQDSTHIWVSK